MFADDNNLLCFHNDIKILFENANNELKRISQWFKVNTISLNEIKIRLTLFHKSRNRDKLPLQLPNLKINEYEIKRSSSIESFGVLVDKNFRYKSSHQRCSVKKGVLKNFTIIAGKHLCWSLF